METELCSNYVDGSFKASPVEKSFNILLEWEVHDSGNVNAGAFELQRKMGSDGSFQSVNTGCIRQNGNLLSCTDMDLYKGYSEEFASVESVMYELYSNSSGSGKVRCDDTRLEYTTNAVRRTWGSIKALFQ
ncbi:MAG: hypothetical protein WD097_01740 [Balneolales bacterium]